MSGWWFFLATAFLRVLFVCGRERELWGLSFRVSSWQAMRCGDAGDFAIVVTDLHSLFCFPVIQVHVYMATTVHLRPLWSLYLLICSSPDICCSGPALILLWFAWIHVYLYFKKILCVCVCLHSALHHTKRCMYLSQHWECAPAGHMNIQFLQCIFLWLACPNVQENAFFLGIAFAFVLLFVKSLTVE